MIFQNQTKKTVPELIFEIIICSLIGGTLGALLLYAMAMEPLI